MSVRNIGELIPDDLFDKIFEYGVSDPKANVLPLRQLRGQGPFVARTYMAKMGGIRDRPQRGGRRELGVVLSARDLSPRGKIRSFRIVGTTENIRVAAWLPAQAAV